MARDYTAQETQMLSRIREQMADAARELADAIRSRRQSESRLREIQHQMATPDGISSAQEFVDDVSRLRREIQVANDREREADALRSRLSAEEMQIVAAAAGRTSETASTPTSRTRPASAGVSAAAADGMKSGLVALRRAQGNYERSSAARISLEKKLAHDIRKTMLVVFLAALFVAAIADILSIIDAGWIVSWLIPGIVWFMVRRVTGINKAGEAIVAAHKAAGRQLSLLQRRLSPAIRSSGDTRLLIATKTGELSWRAKSYVSTFIRDTIVTQLVELIPIIDWLPLYMGQVVKVFIDQNIAYQNVRKLMPHLQNVHRQIDLLEQFEIRYLSRQIAVAVRAQQIRGVRGRASENTSRSTPTAPALAPRFAT